MGKRRKTKQPSILENDFERNADTRHGHISQKRRNLGGAIRALQSHAGMSRGQATAMIDPKRGSRCRGLKPSL